VRDDPSFMWRCGNLRQLSLQLGSLPQIDVGPVFLSEGEHIASW